MMRNIVLILLCVTFFLSCHKEKALNNYVIVAGKVLNNKKGMSINLSTLKADTTIKVKEDGTFIDSIKMFTPTKDYISLLNLSSYTLFLFKAKNRDSIYITFNNDDMYKSLQFSGDNKDLNNLLVNKHLLKDKIKGNLEFFKYFVKEEKDFLATEQQIFNESKSLITNSSLNKEEKEQLLSDIEFVYFNNLNNFEYIKKSITNNKALKVSDDFKKNMPNLIAKYTTEDEELYKKSKYYRIFVNNHNNKIKFKDDDKINNPYLSSFLRLKKMKNGFIKDQEIYNHYKVQLKPTEYVQELYEYAMQNLQDPIYKDSLKVKYERIKKYFPGSTIPVFNYENPQGTIISSTQFKGKYVYIDLWATWCGPCKKEIPSLKELEKDYHNKDIEFVSISLDLEPDKEKWKEMVKDMNLGGVQLIADKNFKSEFPKYFKINSIPRFILLDKEGKIYLADAPRPSSLEIRKIFDKIFI